MNTEKFENRIIEIYESLHGSKVHRGNGETFHSMQRYNEFLTCWKRIHNYFTENGREFKRFLEIGSLRGLWGIAYFAYCEQMEIEGEFTSVTWINNVSINKELYKTLNFLEKNGFNNKLIDKNTLDDDVLDIVKAHNESYNVVFIDGGHSYETVCNDIKKFYPLADDIVLFHDILPRIPTKDIGVYKAINDSEISLDEEIIIPSNSDIRKNNKGIGVKYK